LTVDSASLRPLALADNHQPRTTYKAVPRIRYARYGRKELNTAAPVALPHDTFGTAVAIRPHYDRYVMFLSMPPLPGSRRFVPRGGPLALGVLVVAVLVVPADPAAAAAAKPTCTLFQTVLATTPSATVPWPQQRYDYTALHQITDGSGVKVAVIDSGVDTKNPLLTGQVTSGRDLISKGNDGRYDCAGHGTRVASIIAARSVPGIGLRGLAPGVTILPYRVCERTEEATGGVANEGACAVSDIATAIEDAVHDGAKVINLSLSMSADDDQLHSAIEDALRADIVVVAAVGNRHAEGDPPSYPAQYDGVIGVGAIGPDGQRLDASQVGSYVDIVAPGGQVTGAQPTKGTMTLAGTSFAAPFVAATAALIRAHRPWLTRDQVAWQIFATADPAAGGRHSPQYGWGVLNPMRAVTEVVAPPAKPAPTVSASASPTAAAVAGPAAAPPGFGYAAAAGAAVLAVFIAGVAYTVPLGRRRRWRPGRVAAPPSRE
jgi:type VII secretion-associated serine protease mycosin